MTDKNKHIEFLDLEINGLLNRGEWKERIAMLTEIKGILEQQTPIGEVEREREELRKIQSSLVMPMIGGLLDAWEFLPNDAKGDEELTRLANEIQQISDAMEDIPEPQAQPPDDLVEKFMAGLYEILGHEGNVIDSDVEKLIRKLLRGQGRGKITRGEIRIIVEEIMDQNFVSVSINYLSELFKSWDVEVIDK